MPVFIPPASPVSSSRRVLTLSPTVGVLFDAGDTWTAGVTITEDGVCVDPASLILQVRPPSGIVTAYTYPSLPIVRDGTGAYHANIPLITVGSWVAQWETTDPQQVEGARIVVGPNPVTVDPLAPPAWVPTLARVGALTRARTKDANGNELGTFTTATRPTATEVLILIDLAVAELQTRVDRSIQTEHTLAAQSVAGLRVCMHIERAYFPEQTESRDSAYARFSREYESAAMQLIDAVCSPWALRLA